jgi:4-hydroxyacetophenone monooxygenase
VTTSQQPSGDLNEALAGANIPTLLMLLVQLTGSTTWLEPPYQPARNRGLGDNDDGGLPPLVQQEIRAAAAHAITEWKATGRVAIPAPSPSLLTRMMSVSMGEPIPDEYAAMMDSVLHLGEKPPARRDLTPAGFQAVIIGSGVSGLCAARYLDQRGIRCVIVEKNDGVGGTWFENQYPGAGVDTPSHLYSFSFARSAWSRFFCESGEIRAYLEGVAASLSSNCTFRMSTTVTRAAYDEVVRRWNVELQLPDGSMENVVGNIVISAVGALNRPVVAKLAGLETFSGPHFHSARWPLDLDLTGKRVAIIGTGASAMQIAPAIADSVAELTIFQRSAQWAVPFEKFQRPIPSAMQHLFNEVPLYDRWYRLRLSWTFNDRIYASLQKDHGWEASDSINETNEGYRKSFVRYMKRELGDRQDLLPQVVPQYPPFLKRMLLDNGWFRMLRRDNVHLITDLVDRITQTQVLTRSGAAHGADVLVLATGFDAVHFVASYDVVGRGGRSLREVWDDDDARAYLGTTVPGFPNFFCMYGPNLQPGHGGSLMFIFECQMDYISSLLEQMFADGIETVEPRQDVYDEYNRGVDATHDDMIWTHPGADTYYRNGRGRVVVNSPHRVVSFWHLTRQANLEDYVVTQRSPAPA